MIFLILQDAFMDSNSQDKTLLYKLWDEFLVPIFPLYFIEKLYFVTLFSSIALSMTFDNWTLFQRAGAIIVILSIIGASQSILNRIKNINFDLVTEIISNKIQALDRNEEYQKAVQHLVEKFKKEPLYENMIQNLLKTAVIWAIIGTLINGFGDLIQYPWDYLISSLPPFELSTTKNNLCIKQIGDLHSWMCDAFKQL
ncbi:hypothetical protein [Marinomonas phage MfV]|uniref:Uncharacterized protein n=2 Tax=root TaxID=1 RepID=A0A899ISX3_9VIRU|nr:hypothetical protein [Marinomonas phage MfV]